MIETTSMTPEKDLRSGESDVGLDLVELAQEARDFLMAHEWCLGIQSMHYDRGFPKVAVFLATIDPREGEDHQYWVVVGDVSPLYIDTVAQAIGAEALAGYVLVLYCLLHEYSLGKPLDDLPPLYKRDSLEPLEIDDEVAEALRGRLKLIHRTLLERYRDEIRYDIDDLDESSVEKYM